MGLSIKCLFGFHDLRSFAKIGFSEHIGCVRCKRQFCMSHDVRAVLPWSDVSWFYAAVFDYDPDPALIAQKRDPSNWTSRPHPKETPHV